MPQTIRVEFECVDLPLPSSGAYDHLRLGIQAGKMVEQDQPITGGTVLLTFLLEVVFPASPTAPVFRGPYVQGPRSQPFIYLNWGERKEDHWEPYARSKIMLERVPLELIMKAIEAQANLRAVVRLTDSKGRPAAATLKPSQVAWSLGA